MGESVPVIVCESVPVFTVLNREATAVTSLKSVVLSSCGTSVQHLGEKRSVNTDWQDGMVWIWIRAGPNIPLNKEQMKNFMF